jgi:hypothetical protein
VAKSTQNILVQQFDIPVLRFAAGLKVPDPARPQRRLGEIGLPGENQPRLKALPGLTHNAHKPLFYISIFSLSPF